MPMRRANRIAQLILGGVGIRRDFPQDQIDDTLEQLGLGVLGIGLRRRLLEALYLGHEGIVGYTTFAEPLAHPGEHLREDFLPDFGLTPGALAKAMGLKDRTRIERVVREQQPVTSDTALRLARVFGTTAEFWMSLQTQHDLSKAAIAARDELAAIEPLKVA